MTSCLVLEDAMLQIAERMKLHWVNVSDYARYGIIEGIAHELAHTLDAGPDFAGSLDDMDDADANEREAATLRIEIAALAELGVRLSSRRLWRDANWRDVTSPPFDRMLDPLDQHELDCVRRFVAIVRRAKRFQ